MKFNVSQLLERVVEMNASDLHLTVGVSPAIRVHRALSYFGEIPPLSVEDVEFFLSQVLNQEQKDIFEVNKEIDFSVALSNKVRFRVNAFFQKGYPSVALRSVPIVIPTIEELNLPSTLVSLCELRQGLILVTGPTSHGKSTTIAAMIDRINETRAEHIITIEDPIEYVFSNKLSLIEQREMYIDSHSWDVALKSILRQDPNVVVIGEMRDYETMSAVLTIAETGHLVFATLHTNSASQTIDRVVDSFPEVQQQQVRVQLSQVLEAVVSQRLISSAAEGVVPAVELMLGTTAVKSLIREGKSHQLDNVISTSGGLGMVTLEKSMADLVDRKLVDFAEAIKYSMRPEELRRLIKNKELDRNSRKRKR
jgi:twitching motility protein PilT